MLGARRGWAKREESACCANSQSAEQSLRSRTSTVKCAAKALRRCRAISVMALVMAGWSAAAPDQQPAMPPVHIEILVVHDYWQTNCYLVWGPNRKALVIDPG